MMSAAVKRAFAAGLPAAPAAFAGFPVYIFAPELFTASYGMELALAGALLLALRLVDAFSDPLIGALGDTYPHKRAALTAGALLLTAAGALLLFAPLGSQAVTLRFVAGVFLASLGYSACVILLQTFAALGRDNAERSLLVSAREICGLAGLLLAVSLPFAVQEITGYAYSFFVSAIVCAVLAALSIPFFLRAAKRLTESASAGVTPETPPAPGIKALFRAFAEAPGEVKRFFLIYALFALAGALPAALAVFFIGDRLGDKEAAGGFLLLYFFSALVCIELWRRAAGKYGVKRVWAYACFAGLAAFAGAAFLGEGDFTGFAVICVLTGAVFGAGLSLPSALLANMLHEYRLTARSGVFFAAPAFCQKAALALAAGVSLPALSLAGYVPGGDNPPAALSALSFAYAVAPCFIQAFAALLLIRSARLEGDYLHASPDLTVHPDTVSADA